MSKLSDIADTMRHSAESRPFGYVRTTLPGGLDIVLSHIEEKWRLALRREKVFPSDTELRICQPLFGVPEGTDARFRQHSETHPTTNRRITWQIVEFKWIESDGADSAATACEDKDSRNCAKYC